ncbi:hypothetical protein JZ751_012754 [Albula glossodonta]|uniref:Arsenite methyltransferase n=1 Tax=Albula glossodonta TaxID=121402 RepID=A0A8T2MYX6_9TELE|nr:hypothetical protein JZ751_012754 [Albula glossodonta]
MAAQVHENVQKYYGSRLETSEDLQTNASCALPSRPMSKSAFDALKLVHPEVCKKYFGCGLVVPEKLGGCKILDLGSGSGRDCYILSKLVGEAGHVIGIDMTEELVMASRKYIQYHQEKFGYEKPNTIFVQGYMENLGEAGIQSESLDVLVSNCVICLCPDKKAVLKEAYRVLKDLIKLVQEVGFSTPRLVAASHIMIHNSELLRKTGDIRYASGTYRFFKLPKNSVETGAMATYKGTVLDHSEQLDFDASHSFKTAAILRLSRFSSDFCIQNSDNQSASQNGTPQYCHLSPFLLSDRLGSAIKQCSKTGNQAGCDGAPPGGCTDNNGTSNGM